MEGEFVQESCIVFMKIVKGIRSNLGGGHMCIKHGEASAAGLFNCGLLFNGACGMPDNTLVNS